MRKADWQGTSRTLNYCDYNNKKNWIDFNAGQLVDGKSMMELVPEFIDKVLAVASGEQAQNEKNGYREISIFKNGVTL